MPRKTTAFHNLIAIALVAERQRGTPWKDLEIRFGLCKTRLWQLYSDRQKRESAQRLARKNVHERFKA